MGNKIPITIITGCLGSGKTTVLNYLLQQINDRNVAVIVNEYGKAGLDHHLLRTSEEEISLINSGCMCCNSREDLENELKQLLFDAESGKVVMDEVMIETTGLADPAPIVHTVINHPLLQHHFEIALIITTVDVKNATLQLANNVEYVKQVCVSDHVILTKLDLTTEQDYLDTIKQIEQLNPSVRLFSATHGKVETSVLGRQEMERPKVHEAEIKGTYHRKAVPVESISFYFSSKIDWTVFTLWLSALLHAHGENVLRVKGILDVGEETPINLNGVQHLIHPPKHLSSWPKGVTESFLVFIAREICSEDIMKSLEAFQCVLGTEVRLMEYQGAI